MAGMNLKYVAIGAAALGLLFVSTRRASASKGLPPTGPKTLRYDVEDLEGLQIDVDLGDKVWVAVPPDWELSTNYTGDVEEVFADLPDYTGWEWGFTAQQQPGFTPEQSALPQTWTMTFHGPLAEEVTFTLKVHG